MNHYLSICAVIKNEAPYLSEWQAFHRLQGVEHFYLYDNGSTDINFIEFLNNNLRNTTLYQCPDWNPVQFRAYNHCLAHYGDETKWLAFLDADEFLTPGSDLDIPIPEFLEDMKSYPCVAVNWLIFGSNGHLTKPNGLVIENYTKRQADTNSHVKSIVQPAYTTGVGKNPHYFTFTAAKCAVDEHGNKLEGNYALMGNTHDFLQINHYHTKSKAEYFERKSTKPDPGLGVIRSQEWIETSFKAHDRNEIEDLSAAKFAPIIRDRLCLT